MKKAILMAIVASLASAVAASGGGQTASPPGRTPKLLVLDRIAEGYDPVKFDHAKHIEMAGNCADCHHQHGDVQVRSCPECHAVDAGVFRRTADARKIRPCRECHPREIRPGEPARPTLKVAYHRACFRCHGRDVGSVGEDPKGCTEMCHARKSQARAE